MLEKDLWGVYTCTFEHFEEGVNFFYDMMKLNQTTIGVFHFNGSLINMADKRTGQRQLLRAGGASPVRQSRQRICISQNSHKHNSVTHWASPHEHNDLQNKYRGQKGVLLLSEPLIKFKIRELSKLGCLWMKIVKTFPILAIQAGSETTI